MAKTATQCRACLNKTRNPSGLCYLHENHAARGRRPDIAKIAAPTPVSSVPPRHRVRPGPEWVSLRGTDIPNEGDSPVAPSEMDHPQDHFPDKTFTLKMIPLDDVITWDDKCVDEVHGAHCFTADQYEENVHDVGEPVYDNEGNVVSDDSDYVKALAKDAERLPPLVMTHHQGELAMWGGAHRTAAWRDRGFTEIPAWVED